MSWSLLWVLGLFAIYILLGARRLAVMWLWATFFGIVFSQTMNESGVAIGIFVGLVGGLLYTSLPRRNQVTAS